MDDQAKLQMEIRRVRERCQELETAEENYRNSQSQCHSLQDQLNILKNDNGNLIKDKERLHDKLKEETEAKTGLEKDFEESEKKLMQAQIHLEKLQEEKQILQIQTSKQTQTITNLTQQIENANSKIEQLSRDNEEFDDCLKTADAEVHSEKKQNADLKNIIEQLQQKLNNIKEILSKTTEEKENEIQNLKTKIEQQLIKLDEGIKTVEKREMEIQNLKEEICEITLRNDETVKLRLDNREFRRKNKEITDQLGDVLDENEDLQNKNGNYQNQIKELIHNLHQANENIKQLQDQKNQCEENNQKLQEDLGNTQDDLDKTTNEKNDLSNQKTHLEQNLEDVTAKYTEVKKNLKITNAHLIDTIQQKNELEATNELKNGPLEDVENNMKIMFSKITNASIQLFQEIEKSKQQIDKQYLQISLDNDRKK